MNSKVFDFYEVFKRHGFSEEEMRSVVEGVREVVKDETRENATKGDIQKILDRFDKLDDKVNGLEVSMSKRFEHVHEKAADYHKSTLTWLVSTGIAITGLVVGLIKLL